MFYIKNNFIFIYKNKLNIFYLKMNTEKKDINNSEKILENNIQIQNQDIPNNLPETKIDKNLSYNKANIEMRKEIKNKKRKKIKIRAYCNKCYQFFENGPYSKICKNHLEKKCNLIECQKFNKNGDNSCIRKFTNINSANRHTHCLTKEDIELWDTKCEIQKCLGKKKKESDNKFLDIINNVDNNSNSNDKNINKNIFSDINNNLHNNSYLNMNMNNFSFENNNNSFFENNSQNYFSNNNNNNVIGLIEDIDKLHFNDNDDNEELKNIFDKSNWIEKKNKIEEKNCENNEDSKEKSQIPENFENLSIDEFFEKVQKETNIQNNIKIKLIKAFKKKGILNIKILMLFYEKHKNWDFLIQKFKKITTQIEGVALCIEFLLKKYINKI